MCSKINLCFISFGVTLAIILASTIGFAFYQVYPYRLLNTVSNVYSTGENIVTVGVDLFKNGYYFLTENRNYYWTNLKDGCYSVYENIKMTEWIEIKNIFPNIYLKIQDFIYSF